MKSRSFNLADATILVVAAAVALSVTRADSIFTLLFESRIDLYHRIRYTLDLVLPHAAAMTAALLVMRLRMPRPTLRRLARQPGVAACEVALAALLRCLLLGRVRDCRRSRHRFHAVCGTPTWWAWKRHGRRGVDRVHRAPDYCLW